MLHYNCSFNLDCIIHSKVAHKRKNESESENYGMSRHITYESNKLQSLALLCSATFHPNWIPHVLEINLYLIDLDHLLTFEWNGMDKIFISFSSGTINGLLRMERSAFCCVAGTEIGSVICLILFISLQSIDCSKFDSIWRPSFFLEELELIVSNQKLDIWAFL